VEEKERSWTEAPSGVPNLDTYGMVVAWLIKTVGISPETIARITSYNPAVFLGMENAGKVDEGYVANLVILALKKEIRVSNDKIHSKCAWSPFDGYRMPGCVRHTILKGKILSEYDIIYV
jgi:dihydroorotase